MRIRTLAGPPLPHEIIVDTCKAIILTHSITTAPAEGAPESSTPLGREVW